jgi:bacillithiol biosynthesis deacetylase BshB1
VLDVLVVAPHPDDAELGAGGTILQFKEDGFRVGVLDLTDGEPTPRGSRDLRAQETAAATAILGLDWRGNLGLVNRSLQADLESRRRLAEAFRELRPRWILAPYWVDSHPDHVAATELIEAARFWSKLSKSDLAGQPHFPERILYYYCVHLRLIAQPAIVVDISRHWDKKRAAIECYRSQFTLDRVGDAPTMIERLRDQAAYWGWSISAAYGEPLASREPLGLGSLRDLV